MTAPLSLAGIALLALGCPRPTTSSPDTSADTDTSDTSTPRTTAETGDTGEPLPLTASCAVQELNVLRVTCTVTTSPPRAIEVTLTPAVGSVAPAADAAPRVASSPESAEHTVTVWRLYASTSYDWEVRTVDGVDTLRGTVTTGMLPLTVAVDGVGSGPTTATDDVLFQMDCGVPAALVIDPTGAVVWYQSLADGLVVGTVNAVNITDENNVLALLDRGRIRMFGLDGSLRLDLDKDVSPGFDKFVHHDVVGAGGYVYALNASTLDDGATTWVDDGVYVFDAATGAVVADWSLASVVDPTGPGFFGGYWGGTFPGAIDWAHENGIHVGSDGEWLVSLFELDAILGVDGELGSPTFGALRWVLSGDGDWPTPPDYVVSDPDDVTTDETFGHQHHPNLLADGTLTMLDNGRTGDARVLELSLDAGTGTAAVVASTSLAMSCPFEGGAYPLDNGHRLATCAQQRLLVEVDPATGGTVRTVKPTCTVPLGVPAAILARGIPVHL